MNVKRLSEEEFFERVNFLWAQFRDRPEMNGVSFDDFKKECVEEFKKQNRMSDEQLKQYRDKNYKNIIKETDKLTTEEERKRLNDEDNKTITLPSK